MVCLGINMSGQHVAPNQEVCVCVCVCVCMLFWRGGVNLGNIVYLHVDNLVPTI